MVYCSVLPLVATCRSTLASLIVAVAQVQCADLAVRGEAHKSRERCFRLRCCVGLPCRYFLVLAKERNEGRLGEETAVFGNPHKISAGLWTRPGGRRSGSFFLKHGSARLLAVTDDQRS